MFTHMHKFAILLILIILTAIIIINLDPMPSEYLYSTDILKRTDYNKTHGRFNVSTNWMVARPLQRSDYDKGFLQLLTQRNNAGNVSRKQFDERFTNMKQSGDYYVTVIEDTRVSKLISTVTLTVEQKFTLDCSMRLENVAVNDKYKGNQLGELIVATMSQLAQALGCSKISSDCDAKLTKFYETLGYDLEPTFKLLT